MTHSHELINVKLDRQHYQCNYSDTFGVQINILNATHFFVQQQLECFSRPLCNVADSQANHSTYVLLQNSCVIPCACGLSLAFVCLSDITHIPISGSRIRTSFKLFAKYRFFGRLFLFIYLYIFFCVHWWKLLLIYNCDQERMRSI